MRVARCRCRGYRRSGRRCVRWGSGHFRGERWAPGPGLALTRRCPRGRPSGVVRHRPATLNGQRRSAMGNLVGERVSPGVFDSALDKRAVAMVLGVECAAIAAECPALGLYLPVGDEQPPPGWFYSGGLEFAFCRRWSPGDTTGAAGGHRLTRCSRWWSPVQQVVTGSAGGHRLTGAAGGHPVQQVVTVFTGRIRFLARRRRRRRRRLRRSAPGFGRSRPVGG